jgi:hypothetical protein
MGIILDFDGQTMTWDKSTVKIKEYEDLSDINSPINEFYWHAEIHESQALNEYLHILRKYETRNTSQREAPCHHGPRRPIFQITQNLTSPFKILSLVTSMHFYQGRIVVHHHHDHDVAPLHF